MRKSLATVLILLTLTQAASAKETLDVALNASVDRFAKNHSVAVDPMLRAEMVQSAGLFAMNFCGRGIALSPSCANTIYKATVLDTIVTTFLEDAMRGEEQMLTIAARLAQAINSTMARAGWPELGPNPVAVVYWQHYGDEQLAIDLGAHRVQLGQPNAMLLMPGAHSFALLTNDAKVTHSLVVISAERSQQTIDLTRVDTTEPDTRQPWLEPMRERLCTSEDPTLKFNEGALASFNAGRALLDSSEEERVAHLVPFLRRPVLKVNLADDARLCDVDCAYALTRTFARAIATWRTACERCDTVALTLLSIDDSWWVDGTIANKLRADRQGPEVEPLPGGFKRRGDTLNDGLFLTGSMVYVPLESTLREVICARDGEWERAVRAPLCDNAQVDTFTVRLLAAGESCEGRATTFACAEPGGGIRIVTDLVRLRLPGNLGAIGSAEFALDLEELALHEVGHWFGVPHSNITRQPRALDLMSQAYGQYRTCLGRGSLVMLNNAADDRWEYRLMQCEGWQLPEFITKGTP